MTVLAATEVEEARSRRHTTPWGTIRSEMQNMAMRLFVTSSPEAEDLAKNGTSSRRFLLDSLSLAGSHNVQLVTDPSDADAILFAEWHGDESSSDDISRIIRAPLYRQFGEKVVAHSGKDDPKPLIPGLYPSLDKAWCRPLGCQGAPYLQPTNPLIGTDVGWDGNVTALASFVGSCPGKPVRLTLLRESEQGRWRDILVRDTHADFVRTIHQGAEREHIELKRQFTVDLMSARFALCPAGAGPSSFRIFEAMQAGRSPVIISDTWAPPPGPEWGDFSITIAQSQIRKIPDILKEREGEWAALGAKARKAWSEFYSPERIGITVANQALEIVSQAKHRRGNRVYSRIYVHGVRASRISTQKIVDKAKRVFAKIS